MMLREFFKTEFKLVQMKTGIRQMENIMQLPNWEEHFNQLLDLLVQEANTPPFDLVGVDVKIRVIRDAIITDKDFIGINPKFVRRALNAWWGFNKDKYYDNIIKKDLGTSEPPLTGEDRNKWLEEWKKSLQESPDILTVVPALTKKQIFEEGQVVPKVSTGYKINRSEIEVANREYELKLRAAREQTIRERHPDWTEEQITERLNELEHDDKP